MPLRKRVKYIVTGSRDFPFDMLRYDACYPVATDDAMRLEFDAIDEDALQTRSVTLTSLVSSPTVGRWQSFGWQVSNIEYAS